VNKFRLLNFGKISFDRKFFRSGASADRRIYSENKSGSLPRSRYAKNCFAQFTSAVGATYL
jgi:hypothetical protein